MDKIRLCFVINNMDVGGLEKVVGSLIRHLDRSEFEIYLVCLMGKGKLFSEIDLPESRCLVLQKKLSLSVFGTKVDPVIIVRIRRFLRDHDIEIVHAHNLAPLVFAGIAARLIPRGPRIIYTEHNQIYRADRRARIKFRAYARLAHRIVAVSHDLERTLVQRLGLPAERVRVIHNGIDGARFTSVRGDRVREELGLRREEFLVGTAVVLSEQKGIRYLIDAARQVHARQPAIRFVVAGDGPLRAELERAARDAGLDDSMCFLGYRSDVAELISAFDLYVLASLWEGLPLSFLEALAMGKPILSTSVGGCPEIVEDGVNGYVVAPRDAEALADRILRAYADQGLAERVREPNMRKFRDQFSVESMVRTHAAFVREVMARG